MHRAERGLDPLANSQGFVGSPLPRSADAFIYPPSPVPWFTSFSSEEHVTKEEEEQARKAAKNQALFRDVNKHIEELVGKAWHPEFVCECADEHCVETLELSLRSTSRFEPRLSTFPSRWGTTIPNLSEWSR